MHTTSVLALDRRRFGNAVLVGRKNRKWRQQDLATASGVDQVTISRIERATGYVGAAPLQAVADALSLHLDEFHKGGGRPKTPAQLRTGGEEGETMDRAASMAQILEGTLRQLPKELMWDATVRARKLMETLIGQSEGDRRRGLDRRSVPRLKATAEATNGTKILPGDFHPQAATPPEPPPPPKRPRGRPRRDG